jgi:hypothetical protein
VAACEHDREGRADDLVLAVDDGGDRRQDALGDRTDVLQRLGIECGTVDDRALLFVRGGSH